MLTDSHCHLDQLDLASHENNLDNVLKAANTQGVTHFLCVCIDMQNVNDVIGIAERYDNVDASVGVHPNEVTDNPSEKMLSDLAQHPKVVAIGETGLDYFRLKDNHVFQQERFITHIDVAKAVKKPLVIHTRDAKVDTIRLMQEHNADTIGGVMHCFTEDWTMAKQALDLGFYISISGIVTFKNADQIREVASKVPLERLLIETDSPYLAPVPKRGKPNEPAYVRYVAEFLADLRGISLDELAKATTDNYFKLFHAS